jgi:hypothetical protein
MKIYVGVTDYDWFTILKNAKCDEVNFWRPGTGTNFSALQPNDLFLFKLHSPRNYIVGGGYFVRYSILPTFLAWDAFGIQNGTRSLEELNKRILKYKKRNGIDTASDSIGCIILTDVVELIEYVITTSEKQPNIDDFNNCVNVNENLGQWGCGHFLGLFHAIKPILRL